MKAFSGIGVLILYCMIFFALPAKASHLLGADIFWNYVGADTYLVSVTIYRDCNGIPMPAQPVNIYACGATNGITVNTRKVSAGDITPVCKNSCSRCGNSTCSFAYGIEQYTFNAKVNFKAYNKNCCDFLLSWEACCRNGSISTGAAGENYYVKANVNACIKNGDNSPVFKYPPVMICNVGQCLTFNYAAQDPDMDAMGNPDSLVYLLDTPYQGAGQPVDYSSGYGFNSPLMFYGASPNDAWLPSCKGFHLDVASGDLMFKATKEEITILTILVQEWGKDVLGKPYKKGETRRDITLFILYGNNKVPSLSGINGTDSTDIEMTVGQKKCFTINSMDSNAIDTVTLSAIVPTLLSKSSILIEKKTRHPSTSVCWQPDTANAGHSYQLVLKASDDACPLSGRVSRSYTIHVKPLPKAVIHVNNKGCGNFVFQISAPAGDSIYSLKWSGEDGLSGNASTTSQHYKRVGTYKYKIQFMHENGKADSIIGQLSVAPYLNLALNPVDTLLCLGSNPVLNMKATVSFGQKPYTYSWGSGAAVFGDTGSIISRKIVSDISFYVLVKDAMGCSNWDTIHIKTSKGGSMVKLIPPRDTTVCTGTSLKLSTSATGGDSLHYTYTWGTELYKGKQYQLKADKTENIALKLSDGCSTALDTVHIKVFPPLMAHISNDTSVCLGESVFISASGRGGDSSTYTYEWDQGLGKGPLKTVSPATTSTYTVKLRDACNEEARKTVTVSVWPLPISIAKAIKTTISIGQPIQFDNQSKGAETYLWYFGDGHSSASFAPSYTYMDTGIYSISLIAKSQQGCSNTLLLKDYIHIIPGYHLYLPTGFSPNADGLNDCFMPNGLAIKEFSLEIFNRIGSIIYSGNTCWDGNFHNEPAPEGMYMYSVKVTSLEGDVYDYWGHFYLVR